MSAPHYQILVLPEVLTKLEEIAKKTCRVETLMTRGGDGLDFHDIHVANLLSMLHSAYYEGFSAGMKKAEKIYDAWDMLKK